MFFVVPATQAMTYENMTHQFGPFCFIPVVKTREKTHNSKQFLFFS